MTKMKFYVFLLCSAICISHSSAIVCMSCSLSDLVCDNPKHPEIAIHNVSCVSDNGVNKPACYKIQATIGGVVGRTERGCVANETPETCNQLEKKLNLNPVAVNETLSNFACFLCNTGDKCNSTSNIFSNTVLLFTALLLSVKSMVVD